MSVTLRVVQNYDITREKEFLELESRRGLARFRK